MDSTGPGLGRHQDQTPGEQQQCPRSQGRLEGRGLSQLPLARHLPSGAAVRGHCRAPSVPRIPQAVQFGPCHAPICPLSPGPKVPHLAQRHPGLPAAPCKPAGPRGAHSGGPAPPDTLRAASGGLDLQVPRGARPFRAPRPTGDMPPIPRPPVIPGNPGARPEHQPRIRR